MRIILKNKTAIEHWLRFSRSLSSAKLIPRNTYTHKYLKGAGMKRRGQEIQILLSIAELMKLSFTIRLSLGSYCNELHVDI